MTNDDMLDLHRPTADFRDYLEGEVIREVRRNRTFRRLRAAAVIFVSIGIGMSATLASAQVRQGAQRDSLLDAARADASLAQIRLDVARSAVAEEWKAVNVGARQAASAHEAELAMRDAEIEVGRAALNIQEIEASARAPRDDLNAPLVGGKDFVKLRLELLAARTDRHLKAAEANLWLAQRRVTAGAGVEVEVVDAETAVARARGELSVVAKRLEARKEFLEKGTPVEELTRRIERAEATQAYAVAANELKGARARLDVAEKRHAVGAIPELDVLRARVAVAERQLDVTKARKRLGLP